MLLSIGMIVKNEHAHLRKCLEGVKQILDAVDSELIIADTGSEDDTVEIAKDFTDNVFHFEWCNDYAAARNSTLEKAKGEWFMFIDGDEVIEDASEIIEFFNSGEYKMYRSASYIQRNYSDARMVIYNDFAAPRMCRILPETEFIGKIHEALSTYDEPRKTLNTVAHHYGYMATADGKLKKKSKLYVKYLLEELKENPTGRTYIHLATAYTNLKEYDMVEKYILDGIKVETEKDKNIYLLYALYGLCIDYYSRTRDYNKLVEYAKKYFEIKESDKKNIVDIDIYGRMANAYFKLGEYKDSIETYKKFKSIHALYINGYLSSRGAEFYSVELSNELMVRYVTYIAVKSYIALKNYKSAIKLMASIDLNEFMQNGDDFPKYADILFELAFKTKDYSIIAQTLNKLGGDFEKAFEKEITLRYLNDEELLNSLCSMNINDKKYALILKIRKADADGEDISEMVNEFLKYDFEQTAIYGDIFYFLFKANADINKIAHINSIGDSIDTIKYWVSQICEFRDVLDKYIHSAGELNDFITISFALKLYEILLKNSDRTENEEAINLLKEYTDLGTAFISLAYNQNMINDECIGGYSEDVQFIYYAAKAMDNYNNKNYAECLKQLKSAIKSDNEMKSITEIVLTDIKEKLDKAASVNKEFDEYAQKIKMAFMNLLNAKMAAQARQVLDSYKKVNPSDKDIEFLEKRLELLENN